MLTLSIPVLHSVGNSLYPFCSSSHAQVVLKSWHTCKENQKFYLQIKALNVTNLMVSCYLLGGVLLDIQSDTSTMVGSNLVVDA